MSRPPASGHRGRPARGVANLPFVGLEQERERAEKVSAWNAHKGLRGGHADVRVSIAQERFRSVGLERRRVPRKLAAHPRAGIAERRPQPPIGVDCDRAQGTHGGAPNARVTIEEQGLARRLGSCVWAEHRERLECAATDSSDPVGERMGQRHRRASISELTKRHRGGHTRAQRRGRKTSNGRWRGGLVAESAQC